MLAITLLCACLAVWRLAIFNCLRSVAWSVEPVQRAACNIATCYRAHLLTR
jgi:hypothetical protein